MFLINQKTEPRLFPAGTFIISNPSLDVVPAVFVFTVTPDGKVPGVHVTAASA